MKKPFRSFLSSFFSPRFRFSDAVKVIGLKGNLLFRSAELAPFAEAYAESGGMTEEQLEMLKDKLSG